jgi:hypothetical protein
MSETRKDGTMKPVHELKPLGWWRDHQARFPILSRLARRHLGTAAHSADQERRFSIAGKVYGRDRTRLATGAVDAILFLKVNGILAEKMPDSVF